jgi:hypothetical protein
MNPSSPRQQVAEYFHNGPKNAENWRIRRSNVAGTTDTLKLQPDSDASRSLVPLIEQCVVNGQSVHLLPRLSLSVMCSSRRVEDSECHGDAVVLLGTDNHTNLPQVSRHTLCLSFLLEPLLVL